MLPVRETYFPHNLVDIVHDALDDDVCSVTLCLVEEFGERFFGLIAFFFGSTSRSASTTSLATSRIAFRNSRLVRKPCSWRSLIFSNRSLSAMNAAVLLLVQPDRTDLHQGTLFGFTYI